jgi:elongation factor Ts
VSFTAKDVQTLRQLTGVGMLGAKNALEASDGDMDKAVQLLRVQGKASAAKRAGREAGEGAVAVVRNANVAAIVELRCETDFAQGEHLDRTRLPA